MVAFGLVDVVAFIILQVFHNEVYACNAPVANVVYLLYKAICVGRHVALGGGQHRTVCRLVMTHNGVVGQSVEAWHDL